MCICLMMTCLWGVSDKPGMCGYDHLLPVSSVGIRFISVGKMQLLHPARRPQTGNQRVAICSASDISRKILGS